MHTRLRHTRRKREQDSKQYIWLLSFVSGWHFFYVIHQNLHCNFAFDTRFGVYQLVESILRQFHSAIFIKIILSVKCWYFTGRGGQSVRETKTDRRTTAMAEVTTFGHNKCVNIMSTQCISVAYKDWIRLIS